jgi:tRNA (guanine-N7-)-methyltransferase
MRNHPYAPLAPRLPEGERVDPRELVASSGRAVELEIGPGRGGFVFERLASDPEICIIGLEVRLKWATIVDRRLAEQGLAERARVFAEDARTAVRRFPEACLSAVFVHFPDPWWKKRHEKRLVLGEPLLVELARTLRPGADVFLQTDVEDRAAQYEALFAAFPAFAPAGATARADANPFRAQSPRERRAIADGLPIYRLHYVRRG